MTAGRPGRVGAGSGGGRISPARVVADRVVRRVFEQGAYADRALAAEAAGLDPRERAFAMALTYTTVQRRATLDHVLAQLAGRPPETMQPPLLAALRLGLAQLLFFDGVAEHAAVHESVELAKAVSRGAGGLANAVLRRAAREGRELLAGLDDATAAGAAIAHSVPPWLAEMWFEQLGAEQARALLATVNRPAESALRVNTLVSTVEEVAAALPVPVRAAVGLPEGLVLEGPFDVAGSELWRRGAIMAQSRGSMLPARVLDPQAGERVLDLCAAPGAKTGQLAALMQGRGELVAVERHPGRARALRATLERMHAGWVQVRTADGRELRDTDTGQPFDRVLVDPPCSGLGTLQSRPDLRWHTSREQVAQLAEVQLALLRAGAAAVAPGGTLVYSVCTISLEEGEDVIERFLAGAREFGVDSASVAAGTASDDRFHRVMPHVDGTDGFFVARLRRE
jgi:16S rRNA (cytosine967-C5)-methyltransferase